MTFLYFLHFHEYQTRYIYAFSFYASEFFLFCYFNIMKTNEITADIKNESNIINVLLRKTETLFMTGNW